MPSDAREMTNEELIASAQTSPHPIVWKLASRLSALSAEAERLKAESVVMRELCEAVDAYWREYPYQQALKEEQIADRSPIGRELKALDAYRTMKEAERERP